MPVEPRQLQFGMSPEVARAMETYGASAALVPQALGTLAEPIMAIGAKLEQTRQAAVLAEQQKDKDFDDALRMVGVFIGDSSEEAAHSRLQEGYELLTDQYGEDYVKAQFKKKGIASIEAQMKRDPQDLIAGGQVLALGPEAFAERLKPTEKVRTTKGLLRQMGFEPGTPGAEQAARVMEGVDPSEFEKLKFQTDYANKQLDRLQASGAEIRTQEDFLRQELTQNLGDFEKVQTQFAGLQVSYNEAVAAHETKEGANVGDHALILSYFKMLDPTSVVSLGEVESLGKTKGLEKQFTTWVTRVLQGGALNQTERRQILRFAENRFAAQRELADFHISRQRAIAARRGLNWENIEVQPRIEGEPTPTPTRPTPAARPAAAAAPVQTPLERIVPVTTRPGMTPQVVPGQPRELQQPVGAQVVDWGSL